MESDGQSRVYIGTGSHYLNQVEPAKEGYRSAYTGATQFYPNGDRKFSDFPKVEYANDEECPTVENGMMDVRIGTSFISYGPPLVSGMIWRKGENGQPGVTTYPGGTAEMTVIDENNGLEDVTVDIEYQISDADIPRSVTEYRVHAVAEHISGLAVGETFSTYSSGNDENDFGFMIRELEKRTGHDNPDTPGLTVFTS